MNQKNNQCWNLVLSIDIATLFLVFLIQYDCIFPLAYYPSFARSANNFLPNPVMTQIISKISFPLGIFR